jgi:alcohol dehydrogenase class IV
LPSTEIPEFLFPRRLIRERRASARVGEFLPSCAGDRAALIVADRVVYETGLAVDLQAGIERAGFQVSVFSDVAGEPESDMVLQAFAAGRSTGASVVVGIGGGSALDTAKLVGYALASPTSVAELRGAVPEVSGFPTLVLVPTTVGTGAEATRVAMFSAQGVKRAVLCPQFVPDLAVLDSSLVDDLPASVVASTALDALSHAIESMMSTTSNQLTWQFSGQAARAIFSRLLGAVDGTDPGARDELLYASFLAGVSLNAGVVVGHSMSYVLAARHQLAHGVGCSLALPYCLAYNQAMPATEGTAIAHSILGLPDATLRDLAIAVAKLSREVGLPTTLASVGGTADEFDDLASRVVADYPRPTNPIPLDIARLSTLLAHMHTGDLAGAWTAMGVA